MRDAGLPLVHRASLPEPRAPPPASRLPLPSLDNLTVQEYAFPMHKLPSRELPVGILGASGYAGRELCALVARHPAMTLAFASAKEQCGERVRVAGCEATFVAPDD